MSAMSLDEQAIFEAARKMEPGAAREAYLHQVCGDDAAIGQRIRVLLEALRDLLMEKKTIDAKTITQFAGDKAAPKEHWAEGESAVGGKEKQPKKARSAS